ncbi:MAG TPA: ATP-dependent 6-phosphofructokinase [Candidatus Saccharimonadia bacterium]|jgi:6-phosphofructokinase 1|nr:ATP-dependent 6-phosphofructokinase [Candidatus Saccharimonadia bacterium]
MKRIGIINSGGDCPGLNAVISSIVKTGVPRGYEFLGFERGWEGLLDPITYQALTLDRVRGLSHLGGTILRTANKGRFAGKVGSGDMNKIDPDVLAMAKRNADFLGLEGLIVIGGDGTLSAAMQLETLGLRLVGVPKTIDNDLGATDKTFGFSTAVQIAVDALDRIHTTATSHDRVFLVECMGRHAGWISLYAGLAGSANAILLPEFEFDLDQFADYLVRRRSMGKTSAVVVVAEGIRLPEEHRRTRAMAGSETKLAGVSESLMGALETKLSDDFEMRHVVLGHTQRGGTPNSQDRILAKRYGVEAMLAYDRGETGVMVATRDSTMVTVPIKEAVNSLKVVTRDTYEYVVAKTLGTYLN